jgi:hypothetical protein
MVYCGQGIWVPADTLDNLYGLYEQCVLYSIFPSILNAKVLEFVNTFLAKEMPSILEMCNYWKSFLNPVARKKTNLLLGTFNTCKCTFPFRFLSICLFNYSNQIW